MKLVPASIYEEAAKKLIYDLTSPSGLRWLNGEPAGCQDKAGYWLVRVGARPGKLLRAHRIIWYMHHGTVPALLDHKDDNPANNNISNLRIATESQNRHNTRKHRDNKSGVKGVCWDAKNQKWVVNVTYQYKTHWGGRFSDLEEAKRVACALRNNLHQEYARHD